MAQVGLLEDNMRIAKLCATMLQYVGHRVTIYEHPRLCLDALLAMGEGRLPSQKGPIQGELPVDVLILDLNLPDIPGMEVVHSLHSHPRTEMLPVIFCTAAAPAEVKRALRSAPYAGFLEKPFTFQTLTSAIGMALNSRPK
jgi:CheY-like chemotaxis protein